MYELATLGAVRAISVRASLVEFGSVRLHVTTPRAAFEINENVDVNHPYKQVSDG